MFLANCCGNIVSGRPVTVKLYKEEGTLKSQPVSGDRYMSQVFKTNAPITALEVDCRASGADACGTLLLYRWNIEYNLTRKGEPVLRKDFSGMEGDFTVRVETETPLPAGQYMWVIENGDNMGILGYGEALLNVSSFRNNAPSNVNYCARVTLSETPKEKLLQPSDSVDMNLDVKTPAEPVLGEDHPINTLDPYADTYTATDALGRTLPGYDEVGELREDRFVGMFYWSWHGEGVTLTPYNVTKIINQYPEAINDYNHPAWKGAYGSFFWDEPIYGYYRASDRWVLRKQAEMMAAAGVDVIIFDCTNEGLLWEENYRAIFDTFQDARNDGVKTPQIAFLMAFGPNQTDTDAIKRLYMDIYRRGQYNDLWFYWKGKPLIMAHNDLLVEDKDDKLSREIVDFFTWRPGQPSYTAKPANDRQWGWLNVYPQQKFGEKDGKVEQMTVGVAQNHSNELGLTAMNGKNIFGRTYTVQHGYDTRENAKLYGANFAEQWEYAIEVDPEFIFVTGWNEWTAGRLPEWQGVVNAFPDQFNEVYSRDVEPTKGDLKDNYYYQLVSYIRKYKGVRKPPEASEQKTIDLSGGVSQWDSVAPEFRTYRGNTFPRNHKGYVGLTYTDETGRNDIVRSKVAHDSEYVYFMVETAKDLTPKTDPGWMRLLISTGAEGGWEGYGFIVNRTSPGEKAAVERSTGGWNWETAGEAEYSVSGNLLQLKIPKSVLGLGDEFSIDFKWSDNMQNDGDIMDFYLYGDTAPLGRYNFHYQTKGTA